MTLRTIHPFHQIRYLRVDPNPPTHNDPPTTLLPADAWVAPLSTPDMPALPPKGADTENLLLPFDGRRSPPSELGVLSQSQLLPMKPLPAPSREDDGWLHSCEDPILKPPFIHSASETPPEYRPNSLILGSSIGKAAPQDAVSLLATTNQISCCDCGERRPFHPNTDALAKFIECLSCNTLHHINCLELSYGFVYRESPNPWLCPTCSLQPLQRWHDSFIGHCILLEAPHRKTKKLYPAEIVLRAARSSLVEIRWYPGNSFPNKQHPKGFQISVPVCIEALFRDLGASSEQIGAVRIPIRILEEPDSHGVVYSNTAVESAIEDAFPSILSIALTSRHHPLWDLFRRWNESAGPSGNKIHKASNFLSSHPVPILPGDAALSEPFLVMLTRHGVSDTDAVFVIARLLFGLVTLRTYLDLQPSHDAHIWTMWSEGKFKHRLTPAERALEACTMTRSAVGTGGAIQSIPYHRSCQLGFKIIACTDPCIKDDSFLVDYPPTRWEQSQYFQLSGPGATETPELGVRPRPRPKRKRQLDDMGERAGMVSRPDELSFVAQ